MEREKKRNRPREICLFKLSSPATLPNVNTSPIRTSARADGRRLGGTVRSRFGPVLWQREIVRGEGGDGSRAGACPPVVVRFDTTATGTKQTRRARPARASPSRVSSERCSRFRTFVWLITTYIYISFACSCARGHEREIFMSISPSPPLFCKSITLRLTRVSLTLSLSLCKRVRPSRTRVLPSSGARAKIP